MEIINSYLPMRSTGAAGVTNQAGYAARTGTWVWLALGLALPLSGAEVKL
jgi:hypothetical protein